MAAKQTKSRAEQAVSAKLRKTKTGKGKLTNKKSTKNKAQNDTNKSTIPVRVISSAVCLALFVLLLVMFFKPEGALIALFYNLLHGLLGNVGFVIAIPILLYTFYIHAFSGKRPVRMRTACLASFVLICGCIAHLYMNPIDLSAGFQVVADLYYGGIDGSTGGVICGLLTMLLTWLCGTVVSYIVLIFAAVITLLGGMQITIPAIIRAIQNRPRPESENQAEPEDPATVVVNLVANKHNEYLKRRKKQAEIAEPAVEPEPIRKPRTALAAGNERANEIMRQIDSDVEEPVAASVAPDCVDEPLFTDANADQPINKDICDMPPLEMDEIASSVKVEKVTAKDAEESAVEVALEIAQSEAEVKPEYCFPPIDLLNLSGKSLTDGTAEMRENSQRLKETLDSFKIEAHIVNVTRGPSVTRYEVELEKGVRLNKLTTAADDIALSLGAVGVRIAAVPGKISVVGIEVPNRAVTTVSLREVIDSQEFSKAKSKSSFAVGKDIAGNAIVGNIARLPHMLIAGTTGSGKSVCMNSIILSLLYKASPDDVKLIMVDPKMVELGIYNGIPHLLIPVVVDPKKAAGSLQWAVSEMMRRYKAMSDAGVRDLESYNSIIESQEVDGTRMPQVVVIIDELADLMLVAAKEVEESICRIAQMGRAAGIHLIIATQRPSADVITGLMKANIPSRIAFSVASAMESRIILDTPGAEKLVGKGDMLYAPIGNGKPKRVQGCFVADSEVEAVANYVKANYITNYDQDVMEEIERKAAQSGNKQPEEKPEANANELDGDELLPDAVAIILETGQASVSMLQRRLKLGYARAARIVDEMEQKGIVGPFAGSKPRAILVTKEQWEAMQSGAVAQIGFDDLTEDTAEESESEY